MKSNIGIDVKKMFFDAKAVGNIITKNERRFLIRVGSWIRTVAKRSIRKPTKKQPNSEPGEPPRSQTGYLKKNIFYGFDAKSRSVVIGGAKTKPKGAKLLQKLEFGSGKQKARPFMQPALDKSQGKIREIWRDTYK